MSISPEGQRFWRNRSIHFYSSVNKCACDFISLRRRVTTIFMKDWTQYRYTRSLKIIHWSKSDETDTLFLIPSILHTLLSFFLFAFYFEKFECPDIGTHVILFLLFQCPRIFSLFKPIPYSVKYKLFEI